MHWNPTDERYHEALRRLAVVLLMLAGIAEGIGSRSSPIRSLLLWLLSRAERRVRGFVVRTGAPLPVEYPAGVSVGPDQAARLAHAFRALVAAFFALSRQGRQQLRIARRNDSVRRPDSGRDAAWLDWPFVTCRRSYADTS
jgi:hypothetical protein